MKFDFLCENGGSQKCFLLIWKTETCWRRHEGQFGFQYDVRTTCKPSGGKDVVKAHQMCCCSPLKTVFCVYLHFGKTSPLKVAESAAPVCSLSMDVHTDITGLLWYWKKLKNRKILRQVLQCFFVFDISSGSLRHAESKNVCLSDEFLILWGTCRSHSWLIIIIIIFIIYIEHFSKQVAKHFTYN